MQFEIIIERRLAIGEVTLEIGIGRKPNKKLFDNIAFGRCDPDVGPTRREITIQHLRMYRPADMEVQICIVRPSVYSSLLDHRHLSFWQYSLHTSHHL